MFKLSLLGLLMTSLTLVAEVKMDESLLLFRERCSACHLDSGQGLESLNVASIAGLPRWYVTSQVRSFRDGKRGSHPEDKAGKLMHDISQSLDDRSLAFLGKYVQNLAPLKERRTMKEGEVSKGKAIYMKDCASCHGAEGEGSRKLMAPPLQVQVDWYMLRQMNNFNKGIRSHGEAPKTDSKNLKDLVAYLSSFKKEIEQD